MSNTNSQHVLTNSLMVAKREKQKPQDTYQGSNGYNESPPETPLPSIYKAEWKTLYLYIHSV